MPTTGTSIDTGATTPAGWRDMSHVQIADPTTVRRTWARARW